MRPNVMKSLAAAALALTLAAFAPAARAQTAVPANQLDPFKDTAVITDIQKHLPDGKPVGILEFEDLGCPACARAYPIVHTAIDHYHIPLVRKDYPFAAHIWTRDAAIIARYLQDKVSPEAANTFRGDVFANQMSISSKEDLQNFTRRWFAQHKLQQPFVIDPSGRFAAEVQADYTLGERLGLVHTPTIIVMSPKAWVQVMDVTQLYTVIDQALASVPATHNNVRHPPTKKN